MNNYEEKPVIVIAFGSAKFPSNSIGALPAPTNFLIKMCSNPFDITFVDEYSTTKVCHCCDELICPVKKESRK